MYRFERLILGFNNDMELEDDEDEDEGPTLRSASQEIDDWVVVQHIAEGQHTDQ